MGRTLNVILFVLLALTVTSKLKKTSQNYNQTCRSMWVSGSTLAGSCQKMDGSWINAAFNLDYNVTNNDGTLRWASSNGNFSQSCSNIGLSGSTLTASCRRMNGSWVNTSINLNDRIDNTNGGLVMH